MTDFNYTGKSGIISITHGGTTANLGRMLNWRLSVRSQFWQATPILVAWQSFLPMGSTWSGSLEGIWNVDQDPGQTKLHNLVWSNTYIEPVTGIEVVTDGVNGHPAVTTATGYFYIDKGSGPGSSGHSIYYKGDFFINGYDVTNQSMRYPTIAFGLQGNGKLKLYKDGTEIDPTVPSG